jgi:hypothetical protein
VNARRSYLKTVLAASVATVVLLALVTMGAAALRPTAGAVGPWMLWIAALSSGLLLAGWSSLVVGGGVLALRRETLERQGRPYVATGRREHVAGPTLTLLRRAWRLLRRSRQLELRPGELVRVRALNDILATLDDQGMLEGIPFMPEMVRLCGRQARVQRRADKIYDWVWHKSLRRLDHVVLLESERCSGEAHGDCQARCQLLWNEAWLERVTPAETGPRLTDPLTPSVPEHLVQLTRRPTADGATRYMCQATEFSRASTPLGWNDPRHYARDLLRGNVRPVLFLQGLALRLFNRVQRRRGGVLFPVREPRASTSPHETLNLQPGERVRVKPKREIEGTLNKQFRNRGLWFDVDMLRFCGGEYVVARRVERLINERTGEMLAIANPCIVLEGVHATGEYLAFAPLNEAIFWREIWLERVHDIGHAAHAATR